MSVTVDANILLYASDAASPFHDRAVALVEEIARGPEIAYLFWPTVVAYLRLATHPAVFSDPLPLRTAIENIAQLRARPHVRMVSEREGFWERFAELLRDTPPGGNLVPDAHLATLMLANDVRTIWTNDRDFRRFSGLDVRDLLD